MNSASPARSDSQQVSVSENLTGQSLTVVVPVYNEADCLDKLTEELNTFIALSPVPVSILFVNDGSADNSQEAIEKICGSHTHYHYIQLRENRGLSAALKAGIDHCHTSLVGYIDADIQTLPMDFLKLLEFISEYELVTGVRVKRSDKIIKRFSSKIANTVRRVLINDGIADTGCPLKIMWTRNAKMIPFFTGMHRFIPALIQLQGGRVKQVPVQHFPRFAGKAKYNLRNRMIKPLVDTFAFRWMRSRYIRYQIEKQG